MKDAVPPSRWLTTFLALSVVLGVASVLAFRHALQESVCSREDHVLKLHQLERLRLEGAHLVGNNRGYLLTGDASLKEGADAAAKYIEQEIILLRASPLKPELSKQVSAFQEAWLVYKEIVSEGYALKASGAKAQDIMLFVQ